MAIQKDTIVLTVLRYADQPLPGSLDEIAEFIDTGEGIGIYAVTASTVVPPHAVRQELIAMGNDGSFFEDID